MNLIYKTTIEDDNQLLKNVAKKRLSLSNRLFNKLKLSHNIFINDKIAYANDIIHIDDIIYINLDYKEEDNILAQKGDLEVLYEDEWYIAVNKPANVVVHPCSYHPNNTLANYLKYYLNNNKKIRPVNRLDKGTSGIVLFAKNEYAQELFNNLKESDVHKEYMAIVHGYLKEKEGIINYPIARKENSIIERCVDTKNGQEAVTEYKVLKEFIIEGEEYSLVSIVLKTGRTHQIRVHFNYIGHPLLGDSLYNKKETISLLNRQALHAIRLEFLHPIKKDKVVINCNIENELNRLLQAI